MTKVILITGCSSGIGATMARAFNARGHTVYASARRPDTLAPLGELGIRTLSLDVNDDASIEAAMTTISEQEGRLDMLVNNAGFSQVGAVLDMERDNFRRQYETNVIAPIMVTKRALPLLRTAVSGAGAADVVNIGSIVGLFTTPFAGSYCSSKAALHSLTDALRMELAPFGIRVINVQPGGVKSSFGDNAEQGLRLPENSLWLPIRSGILARAQAGQQGATPTEDFVNPVVDRLLSARPPAVIRGGKGSFSLVWLKRLLPLQVFDGMLARRFGLDKLRTA